MQVLILEDDPALQARLAQTMMGQGFNVLCVETVPSAEAFLRLGMVDVLIAGERIGGRLSHPLALLAECRNPLVTVILLTDRTGPDLDELFELMPSVVGILGRAVAPELVMQIVTATTRDPGPARRQDRLAQARAAFAEDDEDDEDDFAGAGDDAGLATPAHAAPAATLTPPQGPGRLRPAPDTPLARVIAAGRLAIGHAPQPLPVASPVAALPPAPLPAPRGDRQLPAIPAPAGGPQPGQRPSPAPAMPSVPSGMSLPGLLPATQNDRRLHLN